MGWSTYKAEWWRVSGNDEVFVQKFNLVVPTNRMEANVYSDTTGNAVSKVLTDAFGSRNDFTGFAAFLYWAKTYELVTHNLFVSNQVNTVYKIYVGKKEDNRYIKITHSEATTSYDKFRLEYINGTSNFYQVNGYGWGTNSYLQVNFIPWGVYEDGAWYSVMPSLRVDYNNSTVSSAQLSKNLNTTYPWFPDWLNGLEPLDTDNPYAAGGESDVSNTTGNFSEDSDTIEIDDLPTLSAVGTGFATLFTPTQSQLRSLANIMWGTDFISALQNMVEGISEMFTGLAIVPFEVEQGATVEVTWFGWAITEVYLTLAAKQYYEFNMGTINLNDDSRIFTSGSALDYSPYSKLGIYLPFIGYNELDIDECRGCAINLTYRIDILSGTAVAIVNVYNASGNIIYEFTGNCLVQIPITSQSMESLVSDAVNVGISIASVSAAQGAVSSAGDAIGAAEGAKETKAAEAKYAHAQASLRNSEGHLLSATANAAMGMKPSYKKSGAVSAAASILSVRQPYLFLTTPRQSMPAHYQRYCGFPSNITGKLSEFSGYTVVESIRLNDLVATSSEIAEIYSLLKQGVII